MKKQNGSGLRSNLALISKIHFVFAGLFALVIVLSDAWNLIPPSVVLQRWTMLSLLLTVTSIVWYITRTVRAESVLKLLAWLFIICDIALATIMVFAQRGIASKSVILFVFPLIIATLLRSKAALTATAALATAAYSLAVVRYFVNSPGEGYKAELYIETLFYSATFFVIAFLLWSVSRPKS